MKDKQRNPLICFRNNPPQDSCRSRSVVPTQKPGICSPLKNQVANQKSEAAAKNDRVQSIPDIRQEKVARIQKAIREDTYHSDPAKIAEKMIQNEF